VKIPAFSSDAAVEQGEVGGLGELGRKRQRVSASQKGRKECKHKGGQDRVAAKNGRSQQMALTRETPAPAPAM
jgi:hypothetical protein